MNQDRWAWSIPMEKTSDDWPRMFVEMQIKMSNLVRDLVGLQSKVNLLERQVEQCKALHVPGTL